MIIVNTPGSYSTAYAPLLHAQWHGLAGPYFGSFFFAITFMLFCWLIGYLLDKKKIYVRV